ncbi:MAG TPA: hypothetical protein VG204_03785 [Terriglobia bacterium]|nr:hypothetical protein [Terriglobia bacterium]
MRQYLTSTHDCAANSRPRTTPGAYPARELALMTRVFERCHPYLAPACATSSVPAEFLGALTANESGGSLDAARFEPAVYRHLKAVATGQSPAYGRLRAQDLGASPEDGHAPDAERDVEDRLHPKAADYHGRYLTAPYSANHASELAAATDDRLREYATSWGFTQIMGYHVVGHGGDVRALVDPDEHYRFAIELLAEFAADYKLHLAREFAEMFRCWNTGQPYGKTFDPAYVANGLRRMQMYREMLRH